METKTVIDYKSPLGGSIRIIKQTFAAHNAKPGKRIAFLAGLHGDELEGVYTCFRLIRHLRELEKNRPEAFQGEINIYPAANPQALGSASRLAPFFGTDMNRLFGVENPDSPPALSTHELLADIKSCSDLAVDFHAGNLHLKELPQIRIIEGFDKKLIPLARHCNVDLIWVHPMSPVFDSTLGFNLNRSKIPTLVIEAGVCLRLDADFGDQVFRGMLYLLQQTGILTPDPATGTVIENPLVVNSSQIAMINANQPGLFVKHAELGQRVIAGDKLGEVLDPIQGNVLEEVVSPLTGLLFTLREIPITYAGAALARIASEDAGMR